ncbi:hypothetical protein JCM1393_27690 [Clostridium carnis]
MINELKNQNGLLMQMVTILASGQTINLENSIQISGKEIVKQSAKYMNNEINTINKRSNRIAGLAY